MAGTSHYLAVDLGASSGRVVLADWDGDRFSLREVHRFPNGPVRVHDGMYSDVLALWREITEGIGRAGRESGGRLDAIGLDTWGVDFALLDRDGMLLANPRHYRDRRTDGMLELAFETVPREELYAATGIQLMQINTLFQLLAMTNTRSAELEAAATLLPLPNLFYYWLGAPPCAEYTEATTTQCLDVRRRAWALDLLARLGIRTDLLPALVEPATAIGAISADVAAEAGLLGNVQVVAVGSHDTASAVAATPGLDEASAFVSSGTWSLLGVEAAQPVVDSRALAGGFTNEGGVAGRTLLLKNLTGLWLVEECRRQWRRAGRDYSWDDLLALARAAEPFRSLVDPEAPIFMSPTDMPGAIRAFCRETHQTVPEEVGAVVRCCLESLAVRYRSTLGEVQALTGVPVTTLRIVGGGSRNPMLCQFAADACGLPVVAGPAEATALGNVMAQAIAAGELAGLTEGREAVGRSVELERFEPTAAGSGWPEAGERMASWRGVAAS
jgi:rhamnulokinase